MCIRVVFRTANAQNYFPPVVWEMKAWLSEYTGAACEWYYDDERDAQFNERVVGHWGSGTGWDDYGRSFWFWINDETLALQFALSYAERGEITLVSQVSYPSETM